MIDLAGMFRRTRPQDTIVVDDDHFVIASKTRRKRVELDEVLEVTVYKTDLFTTDSICCDVHIATADVPAMWTVCEESPVFSELMRLFEKLPGFERRWYEIVVQPPFAENRTTLFRRDP